MSERWSSLGLTVFLLIVVSAAVVQAVGFNEQARRVPMAVGIPTVILLGVQLGRELLGFRLGAEVADAQVAKDDDAQAFEGDVMAASARGSDVASPDPASTSVGAAVTTGTQPKKQPRTERTEIEEPKATPVQAFGWVLLLAVSFYFLGMLLTAPVFIISFMWVYGKESWKAITLATAIVMGVLHFFFVVFLEVRLYVGVLGERLDW